MSESEVQAIAARVMDLLRSNKSPRIEDVASAIRGPSVKKGNADDGAYDREFTAALSSAMRNG